MDKNASMVAATRIQELRMVPSIVSKNCIDSSGYICATLGIAIGNTSGDRKPAAYWR
jgi:hypothetical protein